ALAQQSGHTWFRAPGPGSWFPCGILLSRWDGWDLRAVEHLDSGNVKGMRRARAHNLDKRRDADSHQLAFFAFFCLLFAQSVIADLIQGQLEVLFIVAAVIFPAQR